MNVRSLLTTFACAAALTAFGCASQKSSTQGDSQSNSQPASAPASQPASQPAAATTVEKEAATAATAMEGEMKKAASSFDSMPPVGTPAVCAVSGEAFTIEEDTEYAEHNGRIYVFCCGGCKGDFEADPARFVKS